MYPPFREEEEQVLTPVQQENASRETVQLIARHVNRSAIYDQRAIPTHKHDNAPRDSTTPLHNAPQMSVMNSLIGALDIPEGVREGSCRTCTYSPPPQRSSVLLHNISRIT